MRPRAPYEFARWRFRQIVLWPTVCVCIAYAFLGVFAAVSIARDNIVPAIAWVTFLIAFQMALWLSHILFYRALSAASLNEELAKKLTAAHTPLTKLHYKLNTHVVEIGAVPLLEVTAVFPPHLYISRATLELMPLDSLQLMVTHSRARVNSIRHYFHLHSGPLSWQSFILFAAMPFLWLMPSQPQLLIGIASMAGLPLLMGAMSLHTDWARRLSSVVLADKHLIEYLNKLDSPDAIRNYIWTIVVHEQQQEAPLKRKHRLRMRLRIFGLTSEEIDQWLAPYEQPSATIGLEPSRK